MKNPKSYESERAQDARLLETGPRARRTSGVVARAGNEGASGTELEHSDDPLIAALRSQRLSHEDVLDSRYDDEPTTPSSIFPPPELLHASDERRSSTTYDADTAVTFLDRHLLDIDPPSTNSRTTSRPPALSTPLQLKASRRSEGGEKIPPSTSRIQSDRYFATRGEKTAATAIESRSSPAPRRTGVQRSDVQKVETIAAGLIGALIGATIVVCIVLIVLWTS